ncbi:MAG: neutral/alkaline non-lysosomal ceramidase N-terminal domain-containing protein [Phycisphaerae bacterium]|nr:neutral/alkaline non-lysosomal ceramidase N-terminal domain-containing protein [Phycisphaerae bacterium]
MNTQSQNTSNLKIGWARADITPPEPVALCGQFHIRMSEGVHDPLTATVLVLDDGNDQAVFVSCDLVATSNELRDDVISRLAGRVDVLNPQKIILHATHTHTAPNVCPKTSFQHEETITLLKIDAMDTEDYICFAGERIADAVDKAWKSRATGKIAFGMDYAVVGRNRRWVNTEGVSKMLGNTNDEKFSHVEGYEDHSVGVIATRDEKGELTGLVVNIACPSQVVGGEYTVSADFWHDIRVELRKRFGETLFILPQLSAAGDQCPHLMYDKQAHRRMLELAGRTEREEYGLRVADAVSRALAILGDRTDAAAPLRHHVETLQLPVTRITQQQAQDARNEAETWKHTFDEEIKKLEDDPSLREQPRWYVPASRARSRMLWYQSAVDRYEQQEKNAAKPYPAGIHVIRLGDIVFATNPFEYYLDFGVFIKVRSKAVQTFLVQLAGSATYVPSQRSTQGGGYGSVPSSNPVGPEGGRMLAEKTIDVIEQLWK